MKGRNASALSDVGLKNTTKIGYLERNCVLDIVGWVMGVLKEEMWKRGKGSGAFLMKGIHCAILLLSTMSFPSI